ncbi:MAG: hypothetical protein OEY23_07455 [Acidimicrobiia bacterium]|nr:hypothetical protein [Acidimicrobiia bacterium]
MSARPHDQHQERESMSKKTTKRKINARRKKANHGTKPNAGRG